MENNKLLAEYCGYIYTKFKGSDPDHAVRNKDGTWINWHPDIDWNQLMMVVEKIEKEKGGFVEIKGTSCFIYDIGNYGGKKKISSSVLQQTKIEAVYNVCVEYINECL